MTFEEAKKILEKEFAVINLHKSTEPFEFDDSNWFGYEKPSVLEAFRVLSKEGYYITISGHDYDMRKKRLEKEYEKNTKAPGSAENRIKEDSGVNPALAESASQFNDALLDEQAKKIKSLVKDITHMDNVIYKKNLEIEELKKKVAEKTKLVEMVRNGSKEYCDYGVAANEFIKELAHLYVLADKNGNINVEMLERCKNYQTYGFPANCNRETKKEINDIARGKENKKPRIHTPEEPKYDSIIERCKRLGIELHYHDGKVPTYTNMYGNEVPVYGLRGIFAICTDEEYKSLFKK